MSSETKRKRTLTDAQIEANRIRAQKSTGPKTAEGKAAVRLNGLKHGLCARVVALPGEDHVELERQRIAWQRELLPRGEVEARLVDQAFAGALGVQRCQKAEAAEAQGRGDMLIQEREQAIIHELEALIRELPRQPMAVTQKLRSTRAGCRWMLARWDALRESIADEGFWQIWQIHQALSLRGHRPTDWISDLPARGFYLAAISVSWAWQDEDAEGAARDVVAEALDGAARPPGLAGEQYVQWVDRLAEQLDEPADALAWLLEQIDAEIAALEELLEAREESEALARELAWAQALADTSKAGALRHRYLMAHRRMMREALKELVALKTAKIESQDFGRDAYGDEESLRDGIRQAEEAAAQAELLACPSCGRSKAEPVANGGCDCDWDDDDLTEFVSANPLDPAREARAAALLDAVCAVREDAVRAMISG